MPLNLPGGKRLAVNIGPDFDAHSAWHGAFARNTPSYLSRGEFDAEVGVPRLLALFNKYDIQATFFTPTHTMATFPARLEDVMEAGHEIAAHGCYHENIPSLDPDEERRLMEISIGMHEKYVGKRPRGFRSPAWDFSDATFDILESWGFDYDSSLMGRDFQAYVPRRVHIDLEKGNTFGDPVNLVELPVSWYLDDFPHLEFIPGINHGPFTIDQLAKDWTAQFDYAYEFEPGGVFCLTVHPGTIGRAHHLVAFERFIQHVIKHDDVWVTSLANVRDTWST